MKRYKGFLFALLLVFLIGIVNGVVDIGRNMNMGFGNITNVDILDGNVITQNGNPVLSNTSGDYLYTLAENKTVTFNETKSDERYFIRDQDINITDKNITDLTCVKFGDDTQQCTASGTTLTANNPAVYIALDVLYLNETYTDLKYYTSGNDAYVYVTNDIELNFNETKSDERYFIRNQEINVTDKNITDLNCIKFGDDSEQCTAPSSAQTADEDFIDIIGSVITYNQTRANETYHLKNLNLNMTDNNITNVNEIGLNLGTIGDNTTCTVITGPTSNIYLC